MGVVHDCLARGDAESWEILIEVLTPPLSRVVSAVLADWGHGPRNEELRDILQEVFLKFSLNDAALLARLPSDSDHAAMGYLKVTTANCARDYLKSEHAGKRGLDRTASIEPTLPSLASDLDLEHIEREVLFYQVDKSLDADEPYRSWFWLYYRQGYSAREISELQGADYTAKGVETAIYRLVQSVKEQLNRDAAAPAAAKENSPGKSL